MSEVKQVKIVCDFNGALRTLTLGSSIPTAANFIKNNVPGVGQAFLAFSNLPSVPVAADFDLHPDWAGHGNLVTNDATKNAQMIQAMLDTPPLDALMF